MVEPDCVTYDLGRKPVTLVGIYRRIIDQQRLTCQYPSSGGSDGIIQTQSDQVGFDR